MADAPVLPPVFVTGASGYMGSRLIAALLARGYPVRGLVRPAAVAKLPAGCEAVLGDALDGPSYAAAVPADGTFVHLVGVPHPNPWKGEQFRRIDLVSIQQAVPVARAAGVAHFVYVSVAQPAPIMRAYQAVRREGEELLRASGLPVTILRPWYVLGPGHRWPLALMPAYKICEHLPRTRAGAQRLGLVTIDQMVATLLAAVEAGPAGVRILGVPEIRGGCVTVGAAT